MATSDPTGSLFATGSADGIVKVWDATQCHCTHVFRGRGGVVSALVFDIHHSRPPCLFSASDDCKIRRWDLTTRQSLAVLDGHSSVVRGLAVTSDGTTLVSGGRDKVYNVWQLPSGNLKHTIPIFETLEAIGLIDYQANGEVPTKEGKKKQAPKAMRTCIWTAGDTGKIRLWDLQTGQAIPAPFVERNAGRPHEIVHVW